MAVTAGGLAAAADERVLNAIAASRLARLSHHRLPRGLPWSSTPRGATPRRARLFACSPIRRARAAGRVRRIAEAGSHVELVVSGLIRAEVSSPDGRSLAIRYAPPGSMLGVASLFGEPYTMPGSLHALDGSVVLERRPDVRR